MLSANDGPGKYVCIYLVSMEYSSNMGVTTVRTTEQFKTRNTIRYLYEGQDYTEIYIFPGTGLSLHALH